MNERRKELIKQVANRRQTNLAVILENVHDSHNIAAVMRSCDAVGVSEIFVLNSDNPNGFRKFGLGKRTSAGARKWVDVHVFRDMHACLKAVRMKYDKILGTHLSSSSSSIYSTDLTTSLALVFGNEAKGISEALLAEIDANIIIPQQGMVRSLNISVACAVTLFEAMRQRIEKGMYDATIPNEALIEKYLERAKNQYLGRDANFN